MKQTDKSASDSAAEERLSRALRLVKQVVEEAGVRDSSEYAGSPEYFVRHWIKNEEDWAKAPRKWPDTRWSVFKWELARDIILCVQVNSPDGVSWVETSLLSTADNLLDGAEKLVTAPQFADVMGLSNQKEVAKEIENNVREVLRTYIDHLPAMMAQAAERARDDCIERQVKASIEPRLRDYCEKFGLPVRPSFKVDWNRQSSANELDTFRGIFLLRARPTITKTLPTEYDVLRQEYKEAKEYYEETKRTFLESGGSEEAWVGEWRLKTATIFPRLHRYLLLSLGEMVDTPRALAKKHLATNYGVSIEYIRKRISALRPKSKKRRPATARH